MKALLYYIQKTIFLFFIAMIMVSFNADEPKIDLIEKVYTHTDRPLYFHDDTIWFKAYVVNSTNTISAISEMLYVDLISPKGSVVKTLRLPVTNGYAYGNFHINKNWVGGIYTIKSYTNWMRNYGQDHLFTKEITVQKIVQPNLLMQLKFEKEAYGKASTVTAKFEVKDLKNQPLKNTEITMAVLISGKTYIKKTLATDTNGILKPTFKLPANLITTDVLLNILTPYKGSTESISRSVPVVLDNLDVQFFPESGKIIAGTPNTIAFKAVNEFGKPADISGKLIDQQGNIVLNFNSYHDGMGGFEFNPKAETIYFAQITKPFISAKKIALPEVHKNGVRFSVSQENHSLKLSIFSNTKEKLQLKITKSSGELLTRPIAFNEKTITVNTEKFPPGITKISILGEMKNILSERLVFMNYDNQLTIDIQLDKETYNTREKVSVTIKTTDVNGKPISSNLSIAIADNKLLSFADDKQDHISSYLLMSSELRGKIHKPQFYFNLKEPKAKKALDYVMLTHGWRSYIAKNNVTLVNASYQPEQLAIQHGEVVDLNGQPISAHLLLFETHGDKVLAFDTQPNGKFSFKLSDRKRYTLVAYTDDNQVVYIHRKNSNTGFSSSSKNKTGVPNPNTPENFFGVKKPMQKTIKQESKISLSLDEDASALDEVVIVGYGITKKSNATGSSTIIKTSEIATQENIAHLLQGKVSGVQITHADGISGAAAKINIRGYASISGNNEPLFVIDGIPMQFNNQIDINTDQIASVSVLKDLAATTLFGTRGSNGVILISTKNYRRNSYNKKKINNKKQNNYTALDFYGNGGNTFDRPDKFYIPIYEGEALAEERTDFRSTIYWNPVVQTNANGEAQFEFYNSDAITAFKITAEGIAHNGLIGRQEKDYSTKKMLHIDFKSPNYMTVGDIISLPLTISNESKETLFTRLQLDLPNHIELIDAIDTNITIAPESSVLKNVKVVARRKGDNVTINATVTSENYADYLRKPVTIISPYFPIETSIAGVQDQTFEIDIDHVVPNSLKANFTLYTNIVGDVMNGIAAMLRQPYGCFEQVSSTTYPNVLVLKYLQETGSSKPRIEKKAKKFIKNGYQRMAAYETKENGFEWYGNTPPHEALSAYGLLQFKEMTDVYEGVDQKMVQRTINWLLSRRDHKGGFLQNKGKYGFSGAPKKVNNAYIVYALTETNPKIDIEKEYQTTYFDALDSLDAYKLALTALSSKNLNKQLEYDNLMSYLKMHIKKRGFEKLPVKNTITRSYGVSRNLETVALTLLALMRDYKTNELIINEGIKYLLKNRNHGRFGATQSTAMVLKVLIAYTQFTKQKIIEENDSVAIHLNGKILHKKIQFNDDGKITIDSLENYLKNGKQKVSIKFNNPKTNFAYNMNIKWNSKLPRSSENCKLDLKTTIQDSSHKVGDIVRMQVAVTNTQKHGLPMATAIIGIPSGLGVQPWQLKEILEQKKVAYYETFDNYLVLYWREMGPQEHKIINLDLKAEIAGVYIAPPSNVYLYYTDEYKKWIKGNQVTILD